MHQYGAKCALKRRFAGVFRDNSALQRRVAAVTCSNSVLTCSNPALTCSNPALTCFSSAVTCSNAVVRCCIVAVKRRVAALRCSWWTAATARAFGHLVTDTTPNYTDTEPFLTTKAIWTYKAIFFVDDAPVGQWSLPVSVTVGG